MRQNWKTAIFHKMLLDFEQKKIRSHKERIKY